uniref:Integrase catalytic domain-containing protein n=1 Tax=Strongyloides venezuelensis TaxID=75913 RepID=A0A0K0FPL3_STRVS
MTCKNNPSISKSQIPKVGPILLGKVHIDLLQSGRKTSSGNIAMIIAIDSLTRFVLVGPVKRLSSEKIIEAIMENIIFKFRCPKKIVTDRETCFTSITYTTDAKLLIDSDDVANRQTGTPMRGLNVGSSLCNHVFKQECNNSQYEGSISNPIILDNSDEEDEIVYASNESDTRLSFLRDNASTDNNIPAAPETPILINHVSSEASENGISSPDEYHMPYLTNYDDSNSILESDLCTKTLEVDDYNHVCFFHRGYFPRRETNTNGSIWDHPSSISFHFNE